MNRTTVIAAWVVRLGLAASFLSAVADRLGLWGPPGSPGVAWGSVPNYNAYTATLLYFLPAALIPVVGWIATGAETCIALGLLIGWRLSCFALSAAVLLTLFATSMTIALGPKPPLDYSVFSAAGAAFLLYAVTKNLSESPAAVPNHT
ncbi:DoxX family protein [Lacipirellula sp.]|uniref:DoxX family protein n=1 Tax=Lacipirellula sp. TaxID=2691419 RepID=UPI003D0A36BC